MKKLILSMLLFITFNMMLSCDNENQESFIKETKSIEQKKQFN